MMAKVRRHPYGKAVVGEEEANLQREVKRKKSNIYGKKVIGDAAASREPVNPGVSGEEVTSQDASMTLSELGELLADKPHAMDRQLDAEFQREEGPRKGALRLFLEIETTREGGARPEVLQLLETALTSG
jgi:hypothetical protein